MLRLKVIVLLLNVGLVGALAAQHEPSATAMRLRTLAQAMHLYANEHRGYVPQDLAKLEPFASSPDFITAAKRDFIYVPPTDKPLKELQAPATIPVAMTRPGSDKDPIVVLFADGHVNEYVSARAAAAPMPTTLPNDFKKGRRQDEKLVGTWQGERATLVLADSGMAVFRSLKGEWSQQGGKLWLVLEGVPGPVQKPETMAFNIDLLNETTLVISLPERSLTFALVRVK